MRRLGLVLLVSIAMIAGPSVTAVAVANEQTSSSAANAPSSTSPGGEDSGLSDLLGTSDEPVTATDRADAQEALQAVEEIVSPDATTSTDSDGSDPRTTPSTGTTSPSNTPGDATLAVRDLALQARALGRNANLPYNQRPWDDGTGPGRASAQCDGNLAHVCLHWTTAAIPGQTSTADITKSSWAQGTVLPVLNQITSTFAGAGYRRPVADGPVGTVPGTSTYGKSVNFGGTRQTDVYLKDLGPGYYGYCAFDLNDDGKLVYYPTRGRSALPAFCVLDNDYALSQYRQVFRGETPAQMLQVTAAHEFFHAIQFAYDALEDAWFMEATATWTERQVFPSVPDNRQYYPYSQIRYPSTSLDTYGGGRGLLQYADWIYFEYLTRKAPAKTGKLPNIIRQIWEYADSLGRDQFSIQAVASALQARKLNFTGTFAQYSVANRRPSKTYLRDATLPAAAPRQTYRLKIHRRVSAALGINHLSSATYRFVPVQVRPSSRTATVAVNMASRSVGTVAIVTVFRKNGTTWTRQIPLNKKGDGSLRLSFSSSKVSYAELTLVNANRSYRYCSNDTRGYSCGGVPKHDHLRQTFTFRS